MSKEEEKKDLDQTPIPAPPLDPKDRPVPPGYIMTRNGILRKKQRKTSELRMNRELRNRSNPPPVNQPSETETHHWVKTPLGTNANGMLKWVPKGTNLDLMYAPVHPYSEVMADNILFATTEGMTITKIAETPGFPPMGTIYKWLREHPEFREKMEHARAARAGFFEDKLIDIALSDFIPEDEVAGKRLIKDTLALVAKFGNRAVYGDQTKISGDPTAPLQVIIETGIRREGDEGFIETTCAPALKEPATKEDE